MEKREGIEIYTGAYAQISTIQDHVKANSHHLYVFVSMRTAQIVKEESAARQTHYFEEAARFITRILAGTAGFA